MTKLYVIVAIVILLGFAIRIIDIFFEARRTKEERYPYVRHKYLLTLKERELFALLQETYSSRYHVFPQIHIASLIDVEYREHLKKTYFNKIIRKSIDFVLFDKENIGPVLAIELDDSTHLQEERMARDRFVDEALKAAGIPLVHIRTQELENSVEIKQKIDLALSNHESVR